MGRSYIQVTKRMKQLNKYSDSRLEECCVYCGTQPDTRDHVPSRVLLDEPFPENLPVVPSCLKCNHDFSLDEEYVACLIECTLRGTTEPDNLEREKVKRILKRKPKLKTRLTEAMEIHEGKTFFRPEVDRLKNVILKLAKGHASYENSEAYFDKPSAVNVKPITTMSGSELAGFYSHDIKLFPEIGSRAFQRLFEVEEGVVNNWIVVQKNIYIYSINNGRLGLSIKFIIWNYLVCEVIWN